MGLQKSFIVFVAALAVAASEDSSQSNIVPLSGAAMQANPDQSMACFNYYVPFISEIDQTYQSELGNCTQAAKTAALSAENATVDQRDALAQSVNASFVALTACLEADSVQNIFQCYIIEGSAGAEILYGDSSNATLELAALNDTLRQIQSEEDLCETQAKVTYEKASEKAYEDFNSCILGLSQVPTTTAAPSTSATPLSSSASPSSSAAPSSSVAPSSTETPASTEAPTSTEASTSTEAPSSSAAPSSSSAVSSSTAASSSSAAPSSSNAAPITENSDLKPDDVFFKLSPRFNYVRA